jgi:serine protease
MLIKLSSRVLLGAATASVALATASAAPRVARAAPGPARAATSRAATSRAATRAYRPGEVIVGYRPAVTAATRAGASARTAASPLRRGARAAGGHAAAGQPAATAPPRVLRLPPHESVSAAIARLRREPGIAYAEPDYIAHVAGGFYPNDPGRTHFARGWERLQWNLLPGTGVNAPQAWANLLADHRPGGRGVVVAVLDTGVAYRRWRQFHKSPDFGGTRFVSPYDFISNNRFPLDRNGHGTFVAGVIAEATNNHFGLTGLAYGASVMPVRVLDANGEGDEATIAKGIRYAVDHGANVINLSLEFLPSQVSSSAEIPLIVAAIQYAHRKGVVVVGAAGNDEASQIAYPARAPDVISVGASTRDRCLADYSNGGAGLDLVAPGGGDDAILPADSDCDPQRNLPPIFQLTLTAPPHWNRFGYPNYYIGTSMSSPEVAAAAALVISSRVIGRHPSPDQVLLRLLRTATPLGGAQPNTEYGWGLLNVGAATDPHATLTPIHF